MDQRDESNNAGHIFGLWRDPTVESYASMIYTDWSNRTIIRGSEIFLQDLIRPSQIYIHKPYRGPSNNALVNYLEKCETRVDKNMAKKIHSFYVKANFSIRLKILQCS